MSTTIMVVDDSPFASKQIKDIVEDNGYEVIGYATDGEEAIALGNVSSAQTPTPALTVHWVPSLRALVPLTWLPAWQQVRLGSKCLKPSNLT